MFCSVALRHLVRLFDSMATTQWAIRGWSRGKNGMEGLACLCVRVYACAYVCVCVCVRLKDGDRGRMFEVRMLRLGWR